MKKSGSLFLENSLLFFILSEQFLDTGQRALRPHGVQWLVCTPWIVHPRRDADVIDRVLQLSSSYGNAKGMGAVMARSFLQVYEGWSDKTKKVFEQHKQQFVRVLEAVKTANKTMGETSTKFDRLETIRITFKGFG